MSQKNVSIFEVKKLKDIYEEIQTVYLNDNKPWVLGYSGGKDSTATLQLVWYAIKELPVEKRQKKIYVISSNTLVESPFLLKKARQSLQKMNEVSKKEGLPFIAEHLKPDLKDSFWVSLLGKGYPAPTKTFRWCTERIKIRPADTFIFNKVAYHGEIIMVLGVRRQESISRAQLMNMYKIKDSLLSKHSKYPQAFVYAPISDFSTDDVWSYLLQKSNPWGMSNRELLNLYKSPDEGECPLVIDKSTSSCGNSRFGCWTCTLVTRDKTLEGFVEKGEEWMRPLVEIRDLLYETTKPKNKSEYRQLKGLNGKVRLKTDKSGISHGPYKLEFLKKLMRKILEAQKIANELAPEQQFLVIQPEEIFLIREMWINNKGDWEDSIPTMYQEILGSDLDWISNDAGMFNVQENLILDEICKNHELPTLLVSKLLDVERQIQNMTKRSSALSKIDKILNEDWRDEEQILEDFQEVVVDDY